MADAGSALPFTAESQVKSGPEWSYSWMLILKKLGTHVNRVVVVGLFHASRVFLSDHVDLRLRNSATDCK